MSCMRVQTQSKQTLKKINHNQEQGWQSIDRWVFPGWAILPEMPNTG